MATTAAPGNDFTDVSSTGGYHPPQIGIPDLPPGVTTPGGNTSSTASASDGSITAIRTPAQLQSAAASAVDAAIADQVGPLQAQIGTLGSNETAAVGDINSMFGSLLPAVKQSADDVTTGYNNALNSEAGIYSAANLALNNLKQQQAQRAQTLAQQIGGPVAIEEFTDPVAVQQAAYANLGAGQMLHTLGFAQAGEQQAHAFAGQVFPVMQTEQVAQARQFYENQKKELQSQIDTLKGTRSGKINDQYNTSLAAERQYQLDQTNQKLEKLKQQEDWTATKKTLANDSARLKLSQKQFQLQAGQVATNNAVTQQKLSIQQKQFAQQQGLSEEEYRLKRQQLDTQAKLSHEQLATDAKKTAAEYLDAATNPAVGKTVTETQAVPVSAAQAFKDPSAYKDPTSSTGYSRLVTTRQSAITQPITDPDALVNYLVSHNVSQAMAIGMVKSRLQLPDSWKYTPPKSKKKK